MRTLMHRLAVVVAMAAMCFGTFGDESWNFNGKFWNYVLEDGKATITGVDIPSGNLELPETVGSDNFPVVAVGDSAFSGSDGLEAVILPASVKKIGYDAFGRCSNLRSVNLGSVEDIGGEAFIYCEELMAVVIPNSTTNIAGSAFAGCVRLSDVTIGSGVAKIGEATIPHYYDATYDYWTTVDFDPAFGGCNSLMNFKLAEGNARYELIDGALYYRSTPNNAKTLAVYPSGRSELSLSGDVTVTAIGEGACFGCNKLTDLTIPSSVRNIGIEAFAHCEGLSSVVIPANSVTNIEFGAFAWDMSVMNVEVAGSVKNIGEWAFMHCFNAGVYSGRVGSLVLHEGIETIGVEAFHRGFCIGEIIIPNSVTSLGEGAFGANRFVRRIVIGSGLDSISDYAFQCDWGSMLSKLEIGPNVTTIGDYAFAGCEKLRVLNIPAGVTEIGDYAFSDCKSLCSLSLPGSLRRIGVGAFGSYYQPMKVARKNVRALLGAGTSFGGCNELRRVLLPLDVQNVGSNAFSSVVSASLDKIYLPASLKASSDAETETYLESLFPTMSLRADDVVWYDDAGDLNYVTVTFDPNSGDAATSVQVLDYVDSFPVPARSGYAFAGWWTTSDDSGEELTMFRKFETDTTCYAHWVETPVTFGDDEPWTAVYDDTLEEMVLESGDIAFGETSSASMSVTGPCVVRFSYKNYMSGWDTSNDLTLLVDGEEVARYGISEDWVAVRYELPEDGAHTVTWRYDNLNGSYDDYARLHYISAIPAEAHTLTFHTEGGTMSAPTSRQVISSPGKLPLPAKDGLMFAGWYTAASGGERFTSSDTVEDDLDLYARWMSAPFTIGGDGTWYVDEDGSYRSTAIARGQQLYAETSFTGPCRISFNWKVHVDSGSDDEVALYIDGEYRGAIGGDMDYWADFEEDVEGDGEHVFRWVFSRPDYGDNNPDMLNCAWLNNISIGRVCAITFDENYEGGGTNTQNLAGTLGELPEPKRDDYFVFAGWFTDPRGGTQVTPATPVVAVATYYAHWTPVPYKFEGEWVEDTDGSWRAVPTKTYTTYAASKEVEGPCTVAFRWKANAFYGEHQVQIIDRVGGNYNQLMCTYYPAEGWIEQVITIPDGEVHTIVFEFYTGYIVSQERYIAIKDFTITPIPSYTATFIANYSGGTNTTKKVVQNAAVGRLPVVWRDGYAMTGWWTAATAGERIATNTVVSSDTAYYAHWAETPFTFSGTTPWSMEEDGSMRSGIVDTAYEDSTATLMVQGPCRVVYEAKTSAGSSTYLRCYADNRMVAALSGEMSDWTTITNDFVDLDTHTIRLDFSKNSSSSFGGENCAWVRNLEVAPIASHAVTFLPNHQGGGDPIVRIVESGKSVGVLPGFFRDGYVLSGWGTAATGGERIGADTVISADVTYYAQWEETDFAFSGDSPWTLDADGSMRAGALVQYEDTSIATISVDGPCIVTFDWKTASENYNERLYFYVDDNNESYIYGNRNWASMTKNLPDAGTYTLSFRYTKTGYGTPGVGDGAWIRNFTVTPVTPCVVTFDRNYDGAPAASTRNVIDGERVGELPDPLRYGYAFTGWYTQAEGGDKVSAYTYITEDVTYYAHWTDSMDKFDSTGGNARWTVDSEGTWRSGLVSGSGASSWASATFEGPCVVSFRWKTTTYYGTLSVALDDGDALDSISSDMTSWAAKEVKIVDGGEHVLKWTYTMNYSYASDSSFGYVRDVVVTPLDVSTVTFNPNYSGGETTTRNVETGDQLGALPTVSRDGYRLVGWFTAAEGGTQITADTVVNGDMTVYAQWVERGLEITYALHDSYGDGWNGCAIKMFNDATDELLATMTIADGSEVSETIPVVAGVQLRFEWVEGSYSYETSFEIRGINGEVVVSGSGAGFSDPVRYVVPGGAPEPPPVTIDDTKMEEPIVNEDGSRTIAAKDGETLTQGDVESVTIASPSDPAVDITAAYKRELDPVNNQIVVTLAEPEMPAVESGNKDAEDATGILEDVSKIDDGKIAELPTPDTSDPDPAKHEEVGALPVKMYKGLWYQASWGDDLNNLTPGTKFQADGTKTHIGVIKQKGPCGFYKLSVSEQ